MGLQPQQQSPPLPPIVSGSAPLPVLDCLPIGPWHWITFTAVPTLAVFAVACSSSSASDYRALTEHLSISGHLEVAAKSFLEGLTLGAYTGGSEIADKIKALSGNASSSAGSATFCTWTALILAAAFVLFQYSAVDSTGKRRSFVGIITLMCAVMFIAGISATALSLLAFREYPLVGTVVFKYQSKSILSTIGTVFSTGNWFIGSVLAVVSLIAPVGKMVMIAAVNYSDDADKKSRLRHYIKVVGKWSMADIMVVSILLAMFAIEGDGFTDSWIGPGTIFYVGYCCLSVWAGQLVMQENHAKGGDQQRAA